MKAVYTWICLMGGGLPVLAQCDLGSLEVARRTHPAVFVPGNVLECTVGGRVGYVYNGEAEQCFTGALAERDSELYREASMDARNNLARYLANREPVKGGSQPTTVQVLGARQLYAYAEKNMRRVVWFVERDKVWPGGTNRIDRLKSGRLSPLSPLLPSPSCGQGADLIE
ncbi:MAG: hypothetical protein Q4E87_07535 [bacterium]|nr:hypothetical protein [bacterium]